MNNLPPHCGNLSADRALGEYWERQFSDMAMHRGYVLTPHQINRKGAAAAYYHDGKMYHTAVLPDITVWSTVWSHGTEHHEIKHKNPTRNGRFGLELYRFDALLWFWKTTGHDVYYTIHNHDLSGGRDSPHNSLEHWLTAAVAALEGMSVETRRGHSYVNGGQREVDVLYWHASLWHPLAEHWAAPGNPF